MLQMEIGKEGNLLSQKEWVTNFTGDFWKHIEIMQKSVVLSFD